MAKNSKRKKPSEYDIGVGRRLKNYRESKNLTQVKLAESIGKSESMVGRYERGENKIPDTVKDLLHSKQGLDCNYLISGDENMFFAEINFTEIETQLGTIGTRRLEMYFDLVYLELKKRRSNLNY